MLRIYKFISFLTTVVTLTSCLQNSNPKEFIQVSNHHQVFRFSEVDDLYQFLTYSEKRIPLISAHRGGPAVDYPENAIETFQRIAYKTPAIIECDIALSKDSVLVLMHDETVNRTTTGKGAVNKHTLAELKKLSLRDTEGKVTNFQIPTLEEVLTWGIGKVIFTLDVKKNVPYQLVIDAIRKTRSEAYVVVITYSADQAAIIHNLAPDLMISASIQSGEDLIRLADRDVPDTRLVAFVGTAMPDKKLTDLLHQHGIICILGTMGNLDHAAKSRGDQVYAEYIENGVDILSTDRPLKAAKSLRYYIDKRQLSSPYIN